MSLKIPKANNDPLVIAQAYADGPGPNGSDFDFFLGEWDASVIRYADDGGILLEHEASWTAQSLFDGRMIEDRFVPNTSEGDIGAVVTLRTYCVASQQWEMVFLWAQQPVPGLKNFVGNMIDGEMRLTGEQVVPDGPVVHSRIRFFKITANSLSWEHTMSVDDGETWHPHSLMDLRRRSPQT
ncbi:hypothetical protein [Pyruvatibacter sp. HU-CL02332]|uniref:hypothetical protein n=1 Tax=Pyruvatibacter sp. HU-CL02332 TaxID=3127650 RepID=UPI00310A779F